MTDKDVMAIAFFEKSLRFFGEDVSEKEHAELREDLPEYATNLIEWGGFDLRERIKTLENENERLREALEKQS